MRNLARECVLRPGRAALLAAAALLAGAGPSGAGAAPARQAGAVVQLLFGGDVMLGRGVARASAGHPAALFAGLRLEVSSADLAAANLESPLTVRPHLASHGPNALEARPAAAFLLKKAGFDAMGVANNHAGDAGPATVTDTLAALSRAGMVAVGGGATAASAYAPRVFDLHGVRVALLAFDATAVGPRAGPTTPGVATWDPARARRAVLRARAVADVVAVGIQGGTEYVSETDPYVMRLARLVGSWGADVVWGQGAHVVQPIRVLPATHDGRPTVVATSLGNLVFDQHIPGTRRGALLEVLAGADGARAYRVGSVRAAAPVGFLGWRAPHGDAAAIAGEWWTLARPVAPAADAGLPSLAGFKGRVVAAAVGDPIGDGGRQLVVAFRSAFHPTNVSALVPRSTLVDRHGLAAHVGLYRPRDLRPLWVAGTLFRPVSVVAACDGAIAVAYTGLNDPAVLAAGAWRWAGFGFVSLPPLAGPGVPACADLDGRLDPVVLERSSR
jgi:hypothetical protein